MKGKVFLFTLLIFIFSVVEAQRYVVGVSPSFIDLGVIKRGESRIVKFYIINPENQELLVYLKEEKGNPDFLITRFPEYVANFSEEDASKWITYFSNPVVLRPQETPLETQVGKVRTWREITFMIKVPLDAEPGYHIISIEPQPKIPEQIGGQIGVGLVSVSKVNILFYVDGLAVRDGEIIEAVGENDKIKIYFKNKGTVTIRARANGQIYTSEGVINFTTSFTDIKPGELGELVGFIDRNLNGEFESKIVVNYLGGRKEKSTTLIFITKEKLPIFKEFDLSFILFLLIIILVIGLSIWYYKK